MKETTKTKRFSSTEMIECEIHTGKVCNYTELSSFYLHLFLTFLSLVVHDVVSNLIFFKFGIRNMRNKLQKRLTKSC